MSNFSLGQVVNIASTASPIAVTNTNVGSGPSRLFQIYVNTALSAHAVQIDDYNATSPVTAARVLFTIPASAAAGTIYTFPGVEFRYQMRVTSTNSAATGNITVSYKPGTAASLLCARG